MDMLSAKALRRGFRAAWTEIKRSRNERAHTECLQNKLDRNLPFYKFDYSKVEFTGLASDRDVYTRFARGSAARFRLTLEKDKSTVDVTIPVDACSFIRYD